MSDQILVGTRKGIFTISKSGPAWEVTQTGLLGDPVTMVLQDRTGAIHAAQNMGHFGIKIKRSTDGGSNWEERPVPSYPAMPEGYEELDPVRNMPVKWDLNTIWSLENGHADRPRDLWCGTIPGGLFHSIDSGDSWQIVDNLWHHPERKTWMGGGADFPGIHSILIDPRNADHVKIGVSIGGLWMSENGGKDWACRGNGMRAAYAPPEQAMLPGIQDPHRIVQCDADPDRLWIQHHNGIFRSDDGGQTCTEIVCERPSSFGFATVTDPGNPDTAWFVPGVKDEMRYPVDGKLVVTRTEDGGQSFDVLSQGLPQTHAYDLVFRHGLSIDAQGQRLAFGSTTGNFWVSENRGESWSLVSSTLPPVYCVSFTA